MLRSKSFRAVALVLVTLSSPGCTQRLYDGPALPLEASAVVHVGETSVLNVDDRFSFALPPNTRRVELAPGPHRIEIAFDRPATTIGMRDVPAQRGDGSCTIEFTAEAGKNYYLGSRALGTDWTMRRWDGAWEGWIRDPSVSADGGIVARCSSRDTVARKHAAAAATPGLPAVSSPIPTAAPAGHAAPAPVPVATPVPLAAPPVPPTLPESAARGARDDGWLRLGTWNLRGLGADNERDYATIASVIDGNFDILTLTEIAPSEGGQRGFSRLLNALGETWAGLLTAAPLPDAAAPDAEHYAIVYRRDRLRTCPGWPGLRHIGDVAGSRSPSSAHRFKRSPVFACFEAGSGAGEFVLAVYRATWAEDADVIAAEVAQIDDVFAAMSRARPGATDLIVAGQFHLETVELQTLTKAFVRTHGPGVALDLRGEPTRGLRDHVVVYDQRTATEMSADGFVFDARSAVTSPSKYRQTVSDHLPLLLRLRVSGASVTPRSSER